MAGDLQPNHGQGLPRDDPSASNTVHQWSYTTDQELGPPHHKSTATYYQATEEDYDRYQRQYSKVQKTPACVTSGRYSETQTLTPSGPAGQACGVSSVPVLTESDCNSFGPSYYDNLTPAIAFELSQGQQPLSVYGARALFPETSDQHNEELAEAASGDENPAHTQGQGGGGRATHIHTEEEGVGDVDKDSNDSDDEDIPEPKLEDVKMADLPKLNLRPEQIDAMYIPDPRHDRRKYDFDPNNIERIPYEFQDALSLHLMTLDLYYASASERNWRTFAKGPASSQMEEKIVERLLELERLQRKTKELEVARRERIKSANLRAKSRMGQTIRQQGAKLGDRKCCSDCLQVACVGDCPGKRTNGATLGSGDCLVCGETGCNGKCCESAYDARSRQTRAVEEEPRKVVKLRPRSCSSCTTKNPSRVITANNLILGRPKSSYTTFSSSQSSSKSSKDLRPRIGAVVSPQLEEEFEKLGIEPVQTGPPGDPEATRPITAPGRRKPRGRSSQLPGKSFFSQRRHSLTDIAQEMSVKSANKKRLKSAKKEKQKT